jgi:hypothetical protein
VIAQSQARDLGLPTLTHRECYFTRLNDYEFHLVSEHTQILGEGLQSQIARAVKSRRDCRLADTETPSKLGPLDA